MKEPNHFEDLTHSIAIARSLLTKAHSAGAAIEGLCLYVSVIDGFLRLALIYTRVQKAPSHTYTVGKNMIRQDDGEKTYTEREVYKMARKEGVISSETYRQLDKMYKFRNKAVHRFSISDVTYKQIADACTEFEGIYEEIFDIVAKLEHGPHGIRKAGKKEIRDFEKSMIKKMTGSSDSRKKGK